MEVNQYFLNIVVPCAQQEVKCVYMTDTKLAKYQTKLQQSIYSLG